MTTTEMVAVLDVELARLRQVRELLAGAATDSQPVERKARSAASATPKAATTGKRRTLSPEARERIAAAQRARWAAHTAAKPVAPGNDAPKRGRGRPRKGAAAKKSAGRNVAATTDDGAETTA